MIKCTCVEKFRDNQNRIIGYKLQDNNGIFQEIDAKTLKRAVKRGEIEVSNLTLTSDDRLVSTTETDKYDLGYFRTQHKDNPVYRRYQSIFDTIGVDVLSIVYMATPREDDTYDTVYRRSFKNFVGYKGPQTVAEFVKDPSAAIGYFSRDKYYLESDYITVKTTDRREGRTAITGREMVSRTPMIVLHKDGEFRVVVCGEIEHNLQAFTTFQEERLGRNAEDVKRSLSIITLNNNLDTVITNVGRHLSNREKFDLANKILESNITLWAKPEAAQKVVAKIGKKDAALKLKACGATTLAVPFAATLAVGALGVGLVALAFGTPLALLWEVISMPFDERVAFGIGGGLGVAALRHAKENAESNDEE